MSSTSSESPPAHLHPTLSEALAADVESPPMPLAAAADTSHEEAFGSMGSTKLELLHQHRHAEERQIASYRRTIGRETEKLHELQGRYSKPLELLEEGGSFLDKRAALLSQIEWQTIVVEAKAQGMLEIMKEACERLCRAKEKLGKVKGTAERAWCWFTEYEKLSAEIFDAESSRLELEQRRGDELRT